MKVDQGELEIIAIDSSKVTGLQEALNNKVSRDEFTDVIYVVEDLSSQMSQFVKQSDYNADMEKVWDILTWKTIEND
jgi:hypothetical protein